MQDPWLQIVLLVAHFRPAAKWSGHYKKLWRSDKHSLLIPGERSKRLLKMRRILVGAVPHTGGVSSVECDVKTGPAAPEQHHGDKMKAYQHPV
ncbi:hypothetical protein DNTS_009019 [Danionella cerebrum]|uniref:Uncharacterized protein n=1 Tax=Danionella cerebrum TaxID=2873325 RepID=A0A553QAG2_9TELE|nr:hypothetical protein DNTS_009019 [Danionella translucida]